MYKLLGLPLKGLNKRVEISTTYHQANVTSGTAAMRRLDRFPIVQ